MALDTVDLIFSIDVLSDVFAAAYYVVQRNTSNLSDIH